MTKINIKINRIQEYQKKCLFCERNVAGEYYSVATTFEIDEASCGIYKNLCLDCHCSLKKHFTGVD